MSIVKETDLSQEIRDWLDLWNQDSMFEDVIQNVRDCRTFVDRQTGGVPRELHTQLILVKLNKAKKQIEDLQVVVKRIGGVK